MTTTTPTTVAVVDPVFSDAERYALAAFLAGYRGLTREAYTLDLRLFIAWCQEHRLRLFAVCRPCGTGSAPAPSRAHGPPAAGLQRAAGGRRALRKRSSARRSSGTGSHSRAAAHTISQRSSAAGSVESPVRRL
jgi:hypothetical protein